jgi:hypothetical protein
LSSFSPNGGGKRGGRAEKRERGGKRGSILDAAVTSSTSSTSSFPLLPQFLFFLISSLPN